MGDGTGYGIVDPDTGEFITKLEGDGDVKLGDSSGDLIQVTGSLGVNGNIYAAEFIYHKGDDDTFVKFTDDVVILKAGGKSMFRGDPTNASGQILINNGGHDLDLVVRNAVTGTLLYTDAGNARVGIGTDSPDYELDVAGNIGVDQYIYHNGDGDTFIQFTDDDINLQAGGVNFIDITEGANSEITFNEAGADIDFRVEGDSETHLLFVDGGNDKIGIGTDSPDYELDVAGDIGINEKLIHNGDADTYLAFSGQNNINLVANSYSFLKYDGDIKINNGKRDRDTKIFADNNEVVLHVDAGTNRVGIGTTSPSVDLDVDGTAKAEYYITAPTATDLLHSTSITLTPVTSLHFLDASGVTLASGKDYFEITLADGTTAGQHLQLAITTAANNPVRVVGDSGGAKATGSISFSGAPTNGQTVSFLNPGGGTTYTVTWDEASPAGNFAVPNATSVTAGIGGAGTANDMGFVMYNAIDTGISVSSWPFTLVGSYAGGSTVTLSQTSAGTNGNQTITENSTNTTVVGFAGGTALVEGTINSTYGVALAGTSAAGGLLKGAHFVWDATTEKWQIIAGTQLTS